MKATVRDSQALGAIRPLELAAYLRANGWREERVLDGRASVWLLGPDNDAFEVLLPLDSALGDYARRMAELLATLETAEERSQLQILADLAVSSADVVRIRSLSPDAEDGSIPVDDGLAIVQRARDAMVAAACSAIDARPYYHTRKPDQALEYARKLRLGQTERGSYVVTILSPVPPALAPSPDGQWPLLPDLVPDPFERQVTRTLSGALATVKSAAAQAISTGSLDPFSAGVPHGISANLCEALAGMAGDGGLEIALSWARTRTPPAEAPHRVVLAQDAIPIIGEAARIFREASPEPTEIHGYVIKLHRAPDALQGEVTVLDDTGDRPRRVTFALGDPEYSAAVMAHRDATPVICCGDLSKQGGAFRLRNPHRFALQPGS